jgi:hypothetical protein
MRSRRYVLVVAPLVVIALDAIARLVVGQPYPGATVLLVLACGLAVLPFLPGALDALSVRIAALPVLGVAAFSILLTTVSLVGIPLTEVSIRVTVVVLVAGLVLLRSTLLHEPHEAVHRTSAAREGFVVAALAALCLLSFASAWDVLEPYPPPGSDWAYYLLYADEVAAQERLLIDDPYAGADDTVFSVQPAVGALYGSMLGLDGVTSESLSSGLAVISALAVLAVFAAVAGLWGSGAGLLAGVAYAVAPIRLDPMYWHGLGTTLALALIPVVTLAVGLVYRGHRDLRTVALLGLGLAGLASAHSASAAVVAVFLLVVIAIDVVSFVAQRRGRRSVGRWWAEGVTRPVLAGIAVACVLGAAVIVHLQLQAANLGRPVSYRAFDSEWIDAATIRGYYSLPLLLLAAASLVLVLSKRELRGDRALLAVAALAIAAVVVSQLWRLHIAFEYRRTVYYLAIALVAVVGIAWLRIRGSWWLIAVWGAVLLYVAHSSIGFRLPQRLVDERPSRSATIDAIATLRGDIEPGQLLVTDGCLGVRVPYVLRTRTLVAAEDWQAGFRNLLPSVRQARTILEGGRAGRGLAESLGVRYAVLDPRCTPDAAEALSATVRYRSDELLIIELPSSA